MGMRAFIRQLRPAVCLTGALAVLAACGQSAPGPPPPAPVSVDIEASMATCSDIGGETAPRLAACTAVIGSDAASEIRAKALNNRGVLESGDGDGPRAMADFDAALAIDPRYSAALYNRAQAWRRSGDTARADADFAQAVRLDPGLAKFIPAAPR